MEERSQKYTELRSKEKMITGTILTTIDMKTAFCIIDWYLSFFSEFLDGFDQNKAAEEVCL